MKRVNGKTVESVAISKKPRGGNGYGGDYLNEKAYRKTKNITRD